MKKMFNIEVSVWDQRNGESVRCKVYDEWAKQNIEGQELYILKDYMEHGGDNVSLYWEYSIWKVLDFNNRAFIKDTEKISLDVHILEVSKTIEFSFIVKEK